MNQEEYETYCPTSREDWRQWLAKNHQSQQSIWVIFYKTSSGMPSLSWSEAVDEALCYGWIDSTKRPLDDRRYMQYFSRRKPRSMWSKINKEKVAHLIQNDLMTKAGMDSIETAKRNGSWNLLDKVEALEIPIELQKELTKHKMAREFFDNLSKSDKKILLYWVVSAKRMETKQKRVAAIVESAKKKLMPEQFRK
ncbi:YdeI/OmpD-associated family protein [bacterium SCSIO 12741]|nr:YdeI/OmpD-associated family protein [bacterium SCSIO 12741]